MIAKRITLLSLGVLLFSTQIAFAEESKTEDQWSISTTLGVVSAPTYVGDDENQLNILPDVRVTYGDRFFASLLGGVGYNFVATDNWKAGGIVKYDFGRDEDGDNPLRISGDDVNDLLGLGDIDGSAEVGAYIEYEASRIRSKLEVRQGLSGGHEGLIAEAEIKFTGQFQMFSKPAFFAVGPEVVYGDKNYNQTYFGITTVQASRSGLSTYQADAGLVSYGLHGSVVLPLNDRITLIGFAGYDMLGDEVADSSLITQRGSDAQAIGGLMFSYQF
ncbi:MipA/OmpV family protein [Shewanella sp. SR44-4]|jgi:outer membrane protein|uniref:MipA/OmpV family protein n=1 Tax=unclassified Shewanella TaxID=196818 RepID=UPI00160279B2|nr:MipA/OmpV family protein [Shewanella sp. SR44-4]MBB1364685.1 MipA/OmpV family protein [Shewanella sp. SR44-4]